MIYSVRGALTHKEAGVAVVECGGVGYLCQVSSNTLALLPAAGNEVTLLCHHNVREDAMDLFGFLTAQERSCFRQLIAVSGVGPKVALSVLSNFTPDRLSLAIASNDVKLITQTPGIGKKTAERIIVELKDKVSNEDIAAGLGADVTVFDNTHNHMEAINALMVLGYSKSEATVAVKLIDGSLPIEEIVRGALAGLAAQ